MSVVEHQDILRQIHNLKSIIKRCNKAIIKDEKKLSQLVKEDPEYKIIESHLQYLHCKLHSKLEEINQLENLRHK